VILGQPEILEQREIPAQREILEQREIPAQKAHPDHQVAHQDQPVILARLGLKEYKVIPDLLE
jgi:hypothetical protein